MPGYGGTGSATLLRDNRQGYLFQQENNVLGRTSVAFQLERLNRSFYPWGASLQFYFTDVNGNPADPGAYELDIQTSDIDAEVQYCTINAISGSSSLNAHFVGRLELPSFWAKYIRSRVVTLTNPVYVTVLVTR